MSRFFMVQCVHYMQLLSVHYVPDMHLPMKECERVLQDLNGFLNLEMQISRI